MSSGAQKIFSDGMRLQVGPDRPVQLPEDVLMLDVRRRRHIVLPVDQLVPFPIVWEQQEVVVGELHALRRAGTGGPHVITLMAAGHGLIVASSSQMHAVGLERDFGCNSQVADD